MQGHSIPTWHVVLAVLNDKELSVLPQNHPSYLTRSPRHTIAEGNCLSIQG